MQSVAGSTTSNMQMQRHTCKSWMNGFAGESVCVYGKAGNTQRRACEILLNVEYHSGVRINGAMRVRDIGQ